MFERIHPNEDYNFFSPEEIRKEAAKHGVKLGKEKKVEKEKSSLDDNLLRIYAAEKVANLKINNAEKTIEAIHQRMQSIGDKQLKRPFESQIANEQNKIELLRKELEELESKKREIAH